MAFARCLLRTFKCPLTIFCCLYRGCKIRFQLMSPLNAHSRLSNYFSSTNLDHFFGIVHNNPRARNSLRSKVFTSDPINGGAAERFSGACITIFWVSLRVWTSCDCQFVRRQFAVDLAFEVTTRSSLHSIELSVSATLFRDGGREKKYFFESQQQPQQKKVAQLKLRVLSEIRHARDTRKIH